MVELETLSGTGSEDPCVTCCGQVKLVVDAVADVFFAVGFEAR